MNIEVIFTAAHAHYPDTEPLGGGKAVADYLCRAYPQWTVLSPTSLGLDAGRSLTELSEWEYARFCRQFERATTAEILKRAPAECVVLSNDISEGPDFAALREYRLVTIFHVDVVEFFTRFYLRDVVRPETAARWLDKRWMPGMLRLVFEKQRECVRHSARIVVPSAPMREMILRCYPWCSAGKIVVLPWGNLSPTEAHASATDLGFGEDEFVIMTLSRLSPEKGIERLLAAMRLVPGRVRVLICGGPAYMKGRAYERKLRRMADERVEFLGHVTGVRKAALLARADLFVSPSRHESYGLTIAEAMAAGCRVISHSHYGAAGAVVDCADARALARAIREAVATGRIGRASLPASRGLAADGSAADGSAGASPSRVISAAKRVAELLRVVAG